MDGPRSASTFPQLFAEVVRERAGHPALIVADETLSYARARPAIRPHGEGAPPAGAGKGTRSACWRPTARSS